MSAMTSIFTYETEPLAVVSPWPQPTRKPDLATNFWSKSELRVFKLPPVESIEAYDIKKLVAEPQEGPVEYKLHLLLRPRRSFKSVSTTTAIGGSHLSRHSRAGTPIPYPQVSGSAHQSSSPAPSSQIRQNRLQHLTTQLLWRLQQSSPNHASTKTDLVLPKLPDSNVAMYSAQTPGPLVAGLEESKGALYEIGVSDDGAFVGLTPDELGESFQALTSMAYSIGCRLKILKMVRVGECQWQDSALDTEEVASLWVSEVFVSPSVGAKGDQASDAEESIGNFDELDGDAHLPTFSMDQGEPRVQQIRVSLTGSTISGKSSLLGTLSTSTLDNGRGKSRLSLFRHRHEIVSGVTSSLAQELIGYQESAQPGGPDRTATTSIVNYASPNTSTWIDVHDSCNPGRLIFLTDSAGHPKFRRTTVRGLVSWAPHWTLCCIAADNKENNASTPPSDDGTSASSGVDLSKAHLELCLKLGLPLVCVVTKLDLASRNSLRHTVSQILSTIKDAGRRPILLASASPMQITSEDQHIPSQDEETVQNAIKSIPLSEISSVVPIVLTSALTGAGVGQVHSLLHQLPITKPIPLTEPDHSAFLMHSVPLSALFHIDEIFAVGEQDAGSIGRHDHASPRYILSGYLRHGSVRIGDDVRLGPFSYESQAKGSGQLSAPRSRSFPGLSKSLPKDFTTSASENLSIGAGPKPDQAPNHAQTWQVVRIASLRHLRLPVRHLSAGQVGTIAISTSQTLYTNAEPCLRRGMVICNSFQQLQDPQSLPPAYKSISAVFADPNIYVNPGSTVTLYTASIRATAKIAEVKVPEGGSRNKLDEPASCEADSQVFAFDDTTSNVTSTTRGSVQDAFALNGMGDAIDDDKLAAEFEMHESVPPIKEIEITFRFINSVEWVEMGTKLLVTPASGISMLTVPTTEPGGESAAPNSSVAASLDGFVGRIVHGET